MVKLLVHLRRTWHLEQVWNNVKKIHGHIWMYMKYTLQQINNNLLRLDKYWA